MKYLFYLLCYLLPVAAYAQARFITVDSAKIWINTIGLEDREEGQPVVIFESGLGTPMGNWEKVLEGVAELAPLVTYDRPGVGDSEPIDEMPTAKNVADRLIQVLNQLEVPPPYVLVGHSLGGAYVRGFANYYPDLLAGLIIVDPADFTETQENIRDHYEVLNWEENRVDSLIQSFIDKREAGRERAPLAIQREGQVLEALRENDFQEITSKDLPNIPVHILTGGRFDLPKKHRSTLYDEEALFRSKMKHRIWRWTEVIQSVDKGMFFYSGDAGHFVHYDDPELLISSVRIVLQDYYELQSKKKD
ncbi:MAG: alpha/beta hydrolase [Bacteroidota bacterium]